MIRQPVSPEDVKKHPDKYNTNNLHQYDPYVIQESKIHIDRTWWDNLTPYIRQLIEERIDQNKILIVDSIETPHEYVEHELELIIYQSYFDGYDYNMWYSDKITNGPQSVTLIKFTKEEKYNLAVVSKQNIFKEEIIPNINLINLKKKLDNALKDLEVKEYFMRVSSTSGKNEVSLEPVSNSDQILHKLTNNVLFLHQEYTKPKDSYLVLMPWNTKLDDRYEFRIFVHNKKLTAVTQQYWFKLYQFSQEELEKIEKALLNIEFIEDIPYNSFVGDVYIDMSDGICKLIECNPFGSQCGAGSGLFEWERDYDILYGKEEDIILRYQSVSKYI